MRPYQFHGRGEKSVQPTVRYSCEHTQRRPLELPAEADLPGGNIYTSCRHSKVSSSVVSGNSSSGTTCTVSHEMTTRVLGVLSPTTNASANILELVAICLLFTSAHTLTRVLFTLVRNAVVSRPDGRPIFPLNPPVIAEPLYSLKTLDEAPLKGRLAAAVMGKLALARPRCPPTTIFLLMDLPPKSPRLLPPLRRHNGRSISPHHSSGRRVSPVAAADGTVCATLTTGRSWREDLRSGSETEGGRQCPAGSCGCKAALPHCTVRHKSWATEKSRSVGRKDTGVDFHFGLEPGREGWPGEREGQAGGKRHESRFPKMGSSEGLRQCSAMMVVRSRIPVFKRNRQASPPRAQHTSFQRLPQSDMFSIT
ncbi:hypothetical protein Bbelb_208870 [Branchiostoma belcheri]|nr:hypothetical protein Bbelb_208870 [Branchiostoma belcheri]